MANVSSRATGALRRGGAQLEPVEQEPDLSRKVVALERRIAALEAAALTSGDDVRRRLARVEQRQESDRRDFAQRLQAVSAQQESSFEDLRWRIWASEKDVWAKIEDEVLKQRQLLDQAQFLWEKETGHFVREQCDAVMDKLGQELSDLRANMVTQDELWRAEQRCRWQVWHLSEKLEVFDHKGRFLGHKLKELFTEVEDHKKKLERKLESAVKGLMLPAGWEMFHTHEGRPYYHRLEDGHVQWKAPKVPRQSTST